MKIFPKISEKKMEEFLRKTAEANPKVTGEVLDMVPIRQKIRETERKTGCHIGHELIYGERSNGKTFQALAWSFYDCAMNGWNMSYIRATKEGFKGKNGRALFEDLSTAGVIEFVTGGEYTGVQYYAQAWYLTKKVVDDKTGTIHVVRDDTQPFCWAIALSTWQTDKGFTLPNCFIHIFDEFVRKGAADPEEFDSFEQVKSTLVRQGATDRIIMLGNTVNKFSVYFRNMRLSKVVKDMEAGDMRIVINKSNEPGIVPDAGFLLYYSDEGLKTPKKSNLFFNYGSGKTNKMITQGSWDMADYPHIGKDKRYASSEVVFTFAGTRRRWLVTLSSVKPVHISQSTGRPAASSIRTRIWCMTLTFIPFSLIGAVICSGISTTQSLKVVCLTFSAAIWCITRTTRSAIWCGPIWTGASSWDKKGAGVKSPALLYIPFLPIQ